MFPSRAILKKLLLYINKLLQSFSNQSLLTAREQYKQARVKLKLSFWRYSTFNGKKL